VVDYHELARRYPPAHRFLMRPQLNGGTLGRRERLATIPESLRIELARLYAQFERYRPLTPIEHSPLKDHAIVVPLETKALLELTAEDLNAYSGSAVYTVGTVDDFKYFFPRIAELALHEVVGMGGWDSWANRVALALTSPAELSAMRAFFRALWTTVNSSESDTIRVDGLEVLHALTYLFDSVLEFLEALDPCTTPMAALNLVDICLSFPGGTVGGRQPPPELTQWFAERAQIPSPDYRPRDRPGDGPHRDRARSRHP
jgi:hypothetical protein